MGHIWRQEVGKFRKKEKLHPTWDRYMGGHQEPDTKNIHQLLESSESSMNSNARHEHHIQVARLDYVFWRFQIRNGELRHYHGSVYLDCKVRVKSRFIESASGHVW